jgi:hypothetical protein
MLGETAGLQPTFVRVHRRVNRTFKNDDHNLFLSPIFFFFFLPLIMSYFSSS